MKGRVLGAIAALLPLAAAGGLLPVKPWLGAALTWAASHREPSALVFIALYVLATVCLIPGLILTLAGGAIFGLARGVVLVSAGSVLGGRDRKSTRLNSSHDQISYAVFCLKKKKKT